MSTVIREPKAVQTELADDLFDAYASSLPDPRKATSRGFWLACIGAMIRDAKSCAQCGDDEREFVRALKDARHCLESVRDSYYPENGLCAHSECLEERTDSADDKGFCAEHSSTCWVDGKPYEIVRTRESDRTERGGST